MTKFAPSIVQLLYFCVLNAFLTFLDLPYSKKAYASGGNDLIIVSEEWPPYVTEKDGTKNDVGGYVTKNLREVLKLAQLDYIISLYPWARSYQLAIKKPNTLIYSITRTSERENLFHWFCPLYESPPMQAFKLKSNKKNIKTAESLKGTTIGVVRGDYSITYLKTLGLNDTNLDVSADIKTNIRKLIFGRVDVVIQSKDSMEYWLKEIDQSLVELDSGLVFEDEVYELHCMALNKSTDQALVERLKTAFEQWKKQNKK